MSGKKPATDIYLMCEGSRTANASETQSLLVGSGRSMLSESLISAFMKLNLRSRSLLIRSMAEQLAHLDHFAVSSLLSEDSFVADAAPLQTDVEKIIHLINDFSNAVGPAQLAWRSFDQEMQTQLTRHGFSARDTVAHLDNLIQLGPDLELSPSVIEHFRQMENTKALVAVADQEHLLMLPGSTPLQKKIFGLLKSGHLMYLSCEIPSTEKLNELAKISDQLLFVKSCGSIRDLSFRDYIQKGYVGFAQTNPQVAFVEMHWPSLLQAGNGQLGNPLPALAKQEWGNPFFSK